MTTTRILRRKNLLHVTQLSSATIYRLIRRGEFPRQIQLSTQAVGWDADDVHAWLEARKSASMRGAEQ